VSPEEPRKPLHPPKPLTWCSICGRVSTHLPAERRAAFGWGVSTQGLPVCPRCEAR